MGRQLSFPGRSRKGSRSCGAVLLALVTVGCSGGSGTTTVQKGDPAPAAAKTSPEDTLLGSLRAQATELLAAFQAGDFEVFVEHVHPKAVAGMGGKEAMAKRIRDGMRGGPAIAGLDLGAIELRVVGEQAFAVVQYTMRLVGPGPVESCLVASHEGADGPWCFLDAGTVTEAQVRTIMPDFPTTLKLPETEQRKAAEAKERLAKGALDVKQLAEAARLYQMMKGSLPESLALLAEKDAAGDSFLAELPKDPWGNDYVLRAEGRRFQVVCAGPDGTFDTEDDIVRKSN